MAATLRRTGEGRRSGRVPETGLLRLPVRGDRPEVALRTGAPEAPVRDPVPAGRPGRVCGVPAAHEPSMAILHPDRPEVAVEAGAVEGGFGRVLGNDDLRAVGRPRGVEAGIAQAAHRLAGGAHDEDAAALASGAEGDVFPVRRECGRDVVRGRVLGEVDGVPPADALEEYAGVAGLVADLGFAKE